MIDDPHFLSARDLDRMAEADFAAANREIAFVLAALAVAILGLVAFLMTGWDMV